MKNVRDLERVLESSDSNLILMVGVALSGKSTFIKKISEYCEVISRDDIIMELGEGLSYSEAWGTVSQKQVSAILKSRLVAAAKSDKNVVIDMMNHRPKGRKAHLKLFPNHTKIAVIINVPDLNVLLERNEKRNREEGKFISEGVLTNMLSIYTSPTKDEGFDYIIRV
mgnify:CR=1 FL=1